jgi:hypothetical protein
MTRNAKGGVTLILALLLGNCVTAPLSITAEQLQQIQLLEARLDRIRDVNDIKRLQRAYGYYLDEGQWTDVADLFTDNASLEIGMDGVYRGRQRIREYFLTLGGGREGLAPGQLNEHLQLMPVITLGDDMNTAKGTWRAVILRGQLGANAFWSEGPYENEYVREGGVWKISKLRWMQTLHVPYEGGWAKNADTNGAKFVGDRLKPDAAPTAENKGWPSAYTPSFHFRGKYPGLLPITSVSGRANEIARAFSAERLGKLRNDTQRLADQDEIENLQRIYGFYIDKGQWSQAAALFTDDAQFEIQGRGIYKSAAHILRYMGAVGTEGLQSGRLYDHMQLQAITHVDNSGQTARGRWHLFAQLAKQGEFHEWETGVYENQYRKVDGAWRISRIHLYPTMITPYESGWAKTSLPASRFEPSLAPDSPSSEPTSTYDHAFIAPFHFEHPVRDVAQHAPAVTNSYPKTDAASISRMLAGTEKQLAAVEDRASIENLQTAYGYYLATLLWDDLAALFTEDGSIEIAMRGVYVGRPAVRRNLNLYGQAGLDDGVLHNHMQYQMVIHVADDGKAAKLRSRALSMMGNFGRNATWMGGTYENEFVKIDGRWMFHKDQQINTYFTPYETGWKDLAQRAPPGVTAANPPDRPPSFEFDMYPKNFLPPYHYVNPVTGRR